MSKEAFPESKLGTNEKQRRENRMINMTNKKMWAIIVALVVVVAIVAVATAVSSKPTEEAEISPPDAPTEVVASEAETESTTAEDGVNMGSITGSDQGNEDMSKLPKEEQDRIKAQHEAEQAKAQEQTQETTTTPEETQSTTPPAQEPTTPPQPSGPSGTAGTAMFNGSPARAFNSVSELNGLQPIKAFETVMINGVPYGWTGVSWEDMSATLTVGGGSLVVEGGLSGIQVGY